MGAPQELLKQYVQSQKFTSTANIMAAMKEMFRDVIQQLIPLRTECQLFYISSASWFRFVDGQSFYMDCFAEREQ